MQNNNSGPSTEGKPLETAKDEFVDERDGNYASNLEYVLGKWIDWTPDRVETLDDVKPITMRHYATYLKRRSKPDDGISESTARTYYNYVSALLTRSVEVGDLAENPAEKREAKKPLPTTTTNSGDQQFWKPEQRRAIIEHVDERARTAIDADGTGAFEEVRDRALVCVLAYTGVRGAEVLADSRVKRRNGLRWSDLDLENGILTVFGKSQNREETALPEQAVEPLRRLETLLDSPADGWPVFPSRHPPSLYAAIDDAGHDKPDGDPWGYVLETGIEPPSISTSGARTLLKRLSDEADVPGLDEDEYLTLHGARRGVGEKLYRERGAAAAQRTLRHADPQTTSEMYSHIEASKLAEDNTEVFDGE
ncbi:tyrosine-type recombinase/integrase [Natrinema soli]|uniref:Tyrosine-type recombinase/integrase n=1 Tax=Natrinema soli TaxID=1930624 RepID=A0ABD5SWA2_9EURY|nr:tyrosine-type recombinase/integrase [Natrinema soli]